MKNKTFTVRNRPSFIAIEYIDKLYWGKERSNALQRIREKKGITRSALLKSTLDYLELVAGSDNFKDLSTLTLDYIRTLERGALKEGVSPHIVVALANALDVELEDLLLA